MKIVEKNKEKKPKTKKKPIAKPKKEHVLVVAQEIKFARLLAGNEKKTRDRALKTLKKWLLNCFQKGYEFKEEDFTRIWKGLFYAVWMSDKPLVQEELCENIASLLDIFPEEKLRGALLLFKVGLRVLATEWYGVDHHRMDKYLMLVRRYLRGSLRCLKRCSWNLESCKLYVNTLTGGDGILSPKTPVYARNATSMILHFIDCFLEELAKVSEGEVPPESVAELMRPFCSLLCAGAGPLPTAGRRLLTALLRQSEPGLSYAHKARAWARMGCPPGGPEALELVSDDEGDDNEEDDPEDDNQERPLDPRAGRVDVLLTPLPVPAEQLAGFLRQMLTTTGSKAHKRTRICLERFEQLARAEYPLRVSPVPLEVGSLSEQTRRSAGSLRALEKRLVAASDELALRGLSRKHRKRLLAKSRAGLSIVEEVDPIASTASANGDWHIDDAEPKSKKSKKQDSDTQVINKNSNKRRQEKENGEVSIKKRKADKEGVGNSERKLKKSEEKVKRVEEKVRNGEEKVKKSEKNKKAEVKVKETSKVDKSNEVHVKKDNTKKTAEKSETKLTNGIKKNKNAPVVIKGTSKNKVADNNKATNEKSKVMDAKPEKTCKTNTKTGPTVLVKVKNFQKQLSPKTEKHDKKLSMLTPKKVKFVLKNNSMQGPIDYYKSVRQSPSIPFDSSKMPSKTNLKPSTPSPINPFFKKKLKMKNKL